MSPFEKLSSLLVSAVLPNTANTWGREDKEKDSTFCFSSVDVSKNKDLLWLGGVLVSKGKFGEILDDDEAGLFGVVGVDFADWLASRLLMDGSLEGGLKLALGGPVRAPPMFSCCRL